MFKAPRRNPHRRHLSSPVSNPKLPDNRISDPTHSSRRPQRAYLRSRRFQTVQDANPHGENHKSRKSQAQDGEHRQEVSSLVFDHQRCMAQLQTANSEERKTIVKRECSKRPDLRGRPGRSNTLIAPTPGVPLDTTPSWLNGLEGQVSAQLAPQFHIDTLLSQDPNERESNVQQMFGQFFFESPGADVPLMSSSQHSSTSGHHASSSRPAFRSGQGFSSASMQSGVPGPSGHTRKRRPSGVMSAKRRQRARAIRLFPMRTIQATNRQRMTTTMMMTRRKTHQRHDETSTWTPTPAKCLQPTAERL